VIWGTRGYGTSLLRVHSIVLTAADSANQQLSWQWLLFPPLLAAILSGVGVAWVQHPRPRLRMAVGAETVEDAVRLWRANKRRNNWAGQDLLPEFVWLTNYGNGIAFDIQLVGSHCLPRVWVVDAPTSESGLDETDPEPEIGFPMWSESLSSLGPGESVTIFAMRPATKNPLTGNPELTVTWPRLPQFGRWRKREHIVLSEAPRVEGGWPGKGENTRR
jgi:hypothetical protein